MRRSTQLCLAVAPFALLAACDQSRPTEITPGTASLSKAHASDVQAGTQTVFASGLTNPRGLTFGPDGALYVAEAGTGGTTTTVGLCQQVPPPGGPDMSGPTGRISRIDASGQVTPVVTGLPSSLNQGQALGVMDVAFVGPKLYALLDAGCGHGVPDVPASVIQVNGSSWSVVANLSAFVHANPVAVIPPDFEPDGDWYSMVAAGGVLFAVDANGGQLVSIKPNSGKIDRVVDISATQGHIVPSAVVEGHGDFLVGNLETFPAVPGGAKILDITRNGRMSVFATGFTTILGLDYDREGRLYVLESFTCPGGPLPCVPAPFAAGLGKVVRVSSDGTQDVIATGLTFPTSMRFGPDGALYVSNKGYGLPPGSGEIVRITVP
jgi:hypothetical protein